MIEREFLRLGFVEPDMASLDQWIYQRMPSEIPIWNWNQDTNTLSLGSRQISEITFVKFGGYGKIYFVYYQGTSKEEYAFMKFKQVKQERLLQEGLIQCVARNCLAAYGFEYVVPRVHTFVRHPQWGLGLCLQRIPGSQILSEYLQTHIQWNNPCRENDMIVLSILVQLATYLAILQKEHGLRHGDLKTTNVLLIIPCPSYTKAVSIGSHSWKLSSSFKTILIDFGFAELQKAITETTKGSDIFFLLCTFWNIPQFRNSLTPSVVEQIRTWLHDGKTDWAKWLEFSAEENIHGMYLFTTSKGFRNTKCQPLSVLFDIQRLYPGLVSIQDSSN
jgi:serine/threonine protein kinase